jgi:hypothetical protein
VAGVADPLGEAVTVVGAGRVVAGAGRLPDSALLTRVRLTSRASLAIRRSARSAVLYRAHITFVDPGGLCAVDPYSAYPHQHGRYFRSIRGVGVATIVFVWIAVAAALTLPFVVIHAVGVINRSFTDESVDDPALEAAGGQFALAVVVLLLVFLTAGILYWVWSWRARGNAEGLAGRQSQDLSRGWTFWGWICPIVNLWFPCQILLDIHRASDRRQRRGAGLVIAWWICFLGADVLPAVVLGAAERPSSSGITVGPTLTPTPSDVQQVDLHHLAAAGVVGVVLGGLLLIAAAVLLTMVIRRISEWQSTPREQW